MSSNSLQRRRPVNNPVKHRLLFLSLLLLCCCNPRVTNALSFDPVAVYLTWQSDPTTTMTLQWITEKDDENDEVYYKKIGALHWQIAVGRHFPMPNQDPYLLHRIELTDLEPGSGYVFRPGNWNAGTCKFRTIPKGENQPFSFVVGGDLYQQSFESMVKTHRQAAKTDPLFALLGGDLAYASSSKPKHFAKEEGKRWLNWLIAWKEHMVTSDGFLIPILPAIGNHDVNGGWNQPKEHAPYFYLLFPFPGKRGYNALDFGHTLSIIVLDSGHTNSIQGEQAHWLHHTLERKKDFPYTVALYHVPAFPSVRRFEKPRSALIRQHWVPLFDTHGLSFAFENHDHAYKRTHPIFRGKVADRGVIYFGDGSWGAKKPRSPKSPKNTWYLAVGKKVQAFILVTLEGKRLFIQGVNSEGEVIDEYLPKLIHRGFE